MLAIRLPHIVINLSLVMMDITKHTTWPNSNRILYGNSRMAKTKSVHKIC